MAAFLKNCWKYKSFSTNPNTKRYWDERLSQCGTRWRDDHYHHIVDLLPRDRSFTLLDIGCAIGDGCEYLQEEFPAARITGVDISDIGITKAKQKTIAIQYVALDILEAPIPGYYDFITIIETLEHFDAPFSVVDKCLKHVNHSLIISVPFNRKGHSPFSEHRYRFDQTTFQRYSHRVVEITEYIRTTSSRCIIYEIYPK